MSKSKSATALTPADLVDWTVVPLQRIEYEAGPTIFAQGDLATSVMYVDRGAVRLSVVSHAGWLSFLPARSIYVVLTRLWGVSVDLMRPSHS